MGDTCPPESFSHSLEDKKSTPGPEMKTIHDHPTPKDADARKAVASVICYPNTTLPAFDTAFFDRARGDGTGGRDLYPAAGCTLF